MTDTELILANQIIIMRILRGLLEVNVTKQLPITTFFILKDEIDKAIEYSKDHYDKETR